MTTGAKIAIVVTAVLTLIIGTASFAAGFFVWALALNGFMAQQRAVDTSMFVFVTLGIASLLMATIAAAASVRFLAGIRSWHPAAAAALTTIAFSIVTMVAHLLCVIVSAIVAEQLRIKP